MSTTKDEKAVQHNENENLESTFKSHNNVKLDVLNDPPTPYRRRKRKREPKFKKSDTTTTIQNANCNERTLERLNIVAQSLKILMQKNQENNINQNKNDDLSPTLQSPSQHPNPTKSTQEMQTKTLSFQYEENYNKRDNERNEYNHFSPFVTENMKTNPSESIQSTHSLKSSPHQYASREISSTNMSDYNMSENVVPTSTQPTLKLNAGTIKPLAVAVTGMVGYLVTAFTVLPELHKGVSRHASFRERISVVIYMLVTAVVGVICLNLVQLFGINTFSDPLACAVPCRSRACRKLVKFARGSIAKLKILTNGEVWEVETTDDEQKYACLFTPWTVTHFGCYLLVGFSVPSLWWISLLLGTGWELFEYANNCHDWIDLAVNSAALAVGAGLRSCT